MACTCHNLPFFLLFWGGFVLRPKPVLTLERDALRNIPSLLELAP